MDKMRETGSALMLKHETVEWVKEMGLFDTVFMGSSPEENEPHSGLSGWVAHSASGTYLVVAHSLLLLMLFLFSGYKIAPWIACIGSLLILITWTSSRKKLERHYHSMNNLEGEKGQLAPDMASHRYKKWKDDYSRYCNELIQYLNDEKFNFKPIPAIRGIISLRDARCRQKLPTVSQRFLADYLEVRAKMAFEDQDYINNIGKALEICLQRQFTKDSDYLVWHSYFKSIPTL